MFILFFYFFSVIPTARPTTSDRPGICAILSLDGGLPPSSFVLSLYRIISMFSFVLQSVCFPIASAKVEQILLPTKFFGQKIYVIKHLFSTHFHISHYDTINYALKKNSQKCDYFFSFFGAAFSNHSSRRKTMRCTPSEKRAEDMRKCPICDVFSTCAPTHKHSS